MARWQGARAEDAGRSTVDRSDGRAARPRRKPFHLLRHRSLRGSERWDTDGDLRAAVHRGVDSSPNDPSRLKLRGTTPDGGCIVFDDRYTSAAPLKFVN